MGNLIRLVTWSKPVDPYIWNYVFQNKHGKIYVFRQIIKHLSEGINTDDPSIWKFIGFVVGLDIGYKIQTELAKSKGVELTADSKFLMGERISTLTRTMYDKGRLGRKTGYLYLNYLEKYTVLNTVSNILLMDSHIPY